MQIITVAMGLERTAAMGRYEKWKAEWERRIANATPYAHQAKCSRCIHCDIISSHIYCSGRGKARRIPYYCWDTDKVTFCPEYIPRTRKDGEQE